MTGAGGLDFTFDSAERQGIMKLRLMAEEQKPLTADRAMRQHLMAAAEAAAHLISNPPQL